MKATKKMFGAVALSAALALGTAVPAFAMDQEDVNGYVVTDDENGNTLTFVEATGTDEAHNTGSSKVRVLSETGQLNATVPVMVYVVANNGGGALLATPTGEGKITGVADKKVPEKFVYSGYRIENNSAIPIRVNSVAASTDGQSANWVYENDAIEDEQVNIVPNDKRGRINLTLTPYIGAAGKNPGDADAAAAGTKVTVTANADDNDALNWDIEPAVYGLGTKNDAMTPGVLGLKLDGTTSVVNGGKDITYGSTDATTGFDEPKYGTTDAALGDLQLVYTIGAVK